MEKERCNNENFIGIMEPIPPIRLPKRRRVRSLKEKEEIKQMVEENSNTRTRTCTHYLSRCKRSAIECIPDELLFEILVRLPAQDIYYGARLVCRKWYHMTRAKSFVHKHCERASYGLLCRHGPSNTLFISIREDGGGIETYKLNYIVRSSIWSSCNGLMLEFEYAFPRPFYYVANDSTDQALHLPPFPYYIVQRAHSGIVYDAASMAYKVVVQYQYDGQHEYAILTVGVDKSWRILPTDHLSFLGRETMMNTPITTQGFMHWNKLNSTDVVTLNLETEILTETPPPIPKVVLLEEKTKCCFFSTGRYLSLLIQRGELVWEVFEMKPDTGEWRKLPNICLEGQRRRIERLGFNHIRNIKPSGWLKYPEVLALRIIIRDVELRAFIIFYNLITCEIGAEKLPANVFLRQVTLDKNSLISLGGP